MKNIKKVIISSAILCTLLCTTSCVVYGEQSLGKYGKNELQYVNLKYIYNIEDTFKRIGQFEELSNSTREIRETSNSIEKIEGTRNKVEGIEKNSNSRGEIEQTSHSTGQIEKICNKSDGYESEHSKELQNLYTHIRQKQQINDADASFLYDSIIYNTFIIELSESIGEYSDDYHVKKIAKNIIKSSDDSLMRSGILFEILEEIPENNIQKKKQYEEDCHEFCLNKIQSLNELKGNSDYMFIEAVKCQHECMIKMSESILKLTDRKEVKGIAENLINNCTKRLKAIEK